MAIYRWNEGAKGQGRSESESLRAEVGLKKREGEAELETGPAWLSVSWLKKKQRRWRGKMESEKWQDWLIDEGLKLEEGIKEQQE